MRRITKIEIRVNNLEKRVKLIENMIFTLLESEKALTNHAEASTELLRKLTFEIKDLRGEIIIVKKI